METAAIAVKDLVRFTNRMKDGDTQFEAIVTSIEPRDGFLYVGYEPTGNNAGLFGYTRIYLDGPRPYGVQSVEVLAHHKLTKGEIWSQNRWYPKPGNRAYDLMC